MKILLSTLLFAAATLAVRADPLTATTAIQTQPDPEAPTLGYLKAGTEPVKVAVAPDGWIAVNVAGPFSLFARTSDLTKGLELKSGTPLRNAPKPDGTILAYAQKGDKTEITGLVGSWVQLKLSRDLIGYVHPAPLPPSAAQATSAPVEPAPRLNEVAPASASGAAADAPARVGHEAAESMGAGAPRVFMGRFTSTHHLFLPKKAYAWQLLDQGGSRIAYLDVTKLLVTEQVEDFAGHEVEVSGPVTAVPGTKDVVVAVENLQLK